MGTAVVLGRDLDVLVSLAAIQLPVLDTQIGEVDLVIEVGEAVL